MNERMFFWLCCALFLLSASILFSFILLSDAQEFEINPYTTKVTCDGGCTFRAMVSEVRDNNETMFYKLNRVVLVDAVFFVGTKKPTFVEGDCVMVSGTVQTYKGRDSIVAQTLKKCD